MHNPIGFSLLLLFSLHLPLHLLWASVAFAATTPGSSEVVLDIKRGRSYLPFRSDETLNPKSDKIFALSFSVRFDRLPEVGVRQTILTKLEESQAMTGYGIGTLRTATAIRPAVYWRDAFGKGGWYVFDQVDIKPHVWYSISLVVQSGVFMNLFVERLGLDDAPVFVGGYSIADVGSAANDADLIIGPVRPTKTSFRGQIAGLAVIQTSKLVEVKSADDLRPILQGGPGVISGRFGNEELALLLTSGKDESRMHRAVKIVGQATWETLDRKTSLEKSSEETELAEDTE